MTIGSTLTVAEYLSNNIENYYYDKFSKSCIENQNDSSLDAILSNIPYLLNAEVAGYIPVIENDNYNVCLIRGNQAKRECNIWGFRHTVPEFECLNLKQLQCRGMESEGKCLWDELYRESTKLNDRTRLIIFPVNICDIVQEIKKHTPEIFVKTDGDYKEYIDVRQSYEKMLDKDDFKQILDGNSSKLAKVLMAWKLEDKVSERNYLVWCLLDLSPWEFNKYKLSIIRKITTVSEIKKQTAELLKSWRTIKLQGHLLRNFPHITLRYIVGSLSDSQLNGKERNFIVNYITERGEYLQDVSGIVGIGTPSSHKHVLNQEINICHEIKQITTINLFRTRDLTLWGSKKWLDLFETNCNECSERSKTIKCPQGGLGAFYTIIENIIHNAIFKGGNTIENDAGEKSFKDGFKIKLQCHFINNSVELKIGDTTSPLNKEMQKFFSSNPDIVEPGDIGLGIYSTYCAALYISAAPPRLVFKDEEGCIDGCNYTYIFQMQKG